MSKEELQQVLADRKQQIKERLRNTHAVVEDMKNIGNNTNLELFRQGEKLVAIDKKLNEVDHDVQYGNYIAEGMNSFWTRLKHKITGGFKYKEGQPLPKEPQFTETPSTNKAPSMGSNPMGQTKLEEEYTAEDPQIDECLDSINQRLQQMRNIARLTSHAIDCQAVHIRSINDKTDKNQKNMQKANRNVKKLLS